jgi:hypothetical protein
MKRVVTVLALVLAAGCASIQSGDQLKIAALQAIGAERVAWLTNNTATIPSGVDALNLKDMHAYVDKVDSGSGTATITYRYTGTFSTPQGQRDGTLTVQRRLHFTRSDSGTWSQSAPAEEIARNSSWSAGRQAS